jgi:hypothetical protein
VISNAPNATYTIPFAGKPAYLSPALDPTFSTWVVRIAGNTGDTGTDTLSHAYKWGRDVRQEYAKDQPWSGDGSLIYLENTEGTGTTPSQLYLDGVHYTVVYGKPSATPSGSIEGRWIPGTDATRLIAQYPGDQLYTLDVPGNTLTNTWTLPVSVTGVGPDEGNLSADGSLVALVEDTDLTTTCRMFVFDVNAGTAGPRYDLYGDGGVPTDGSWTVDWVSVSPSGSYVVVKYGNNTEALRVFDVNPSTLALTPRANSHNWTGQAGLGGNGFIYTLGHADLAKDPGSSNDDVIIGQEAAGNRNANVTGISTVGTNGIGHVVKVRLRDNQPASLTDYGNGGSVPYEAWAAHISCRNYGRPGWCYVTYEVESGKRYSGEVVALKIDGTGTVERYAHYHSDYSNLTGTTGSYESADSDYDYRSQGHAVPSPDGMRIMVASNWVYQGNGGASIQAYVLGINMSTSTVYTYFAKEIGDASSGAQINLGSNTFKVALLTSSYTPARDTDQYWSDISANEASGTGYTAGGQALGGVSWARDASNHRSVLTASNPSWSSTTITFRYAVVYKTTGTASTSPLVCYCDFGSNQSATNGTVTIQYDGTNGILNLTCS